MRFSAGVSRLRTGLRWTRWPACAIAAGAAGALLAQVYFAAPQTRRRPTEYEVEAAYLYNFGKFVRWPPSTPRSGKLFPICVLGQDPFGPILDATVADEAVNGKEVVAKRISSLEAAAGCRILFIGSSERKQMEQILNQADKMEVLTVSDAPRFLQEGGMIEFVLIQDHVRFEVNLTAARRAGLDLSSELLKVATRVITRKAS
ncbi:MAG TPA: YfiR family protein [Terriglobia bacterium]|nr:YfiR family protein [Terriglobia bacterium]